MAQASETAPIVLGAQIAALSDVPSPAGATGRGSPASRSHPRGAFGRLLAGRDAGGDEGGALVPHAAVSARRTAAGRFAAITWLLR